MTTATEQTCDPQARVVFESEWTRLIVASALWSELNNVTEENATTGPFIWDLVQESGVTLEQHWADYEGGTRQLRDLEAAVRDISSPACQERVLPMGHSRLVYWVDDLVSYLRHEGLATGDVDEDGPRTLEFLQHAVRFLKSLQAEGGGA